MTKEERGSTGSGKWFLGIDIGTSSCKGIILDLTDGIIAEAEAKHDVESPHEGWFEHDSEQVWWGGSLNVIQSLISQVIDSRKRIAAIGVSGLGPNMLPVDVNGQPLRKAILYGIDTRADEEIHALQNMLGAERISRNGNRVSSQAVGAKILWYKRHEPHLFQKTHKVLGASGYLIYRLTGCMSLDHIEASFYSPFYRLADGTWDIEAMAQADISADLIPKTCWPQDVVGHITQDTATQTGLPIGIPVCGGKIDHPAERLLATGRREKQGILSYGSSLTIATVTKKVLIDPRLVSMNYCFPGYFSVGGAMASAGSLTKWFTSHFGDKELERTNNASARTHHQLTSEAACLSPGSDGLLALPYFVGERTPIWDSQARGAFLGLTLGHTQAHLYRALLESIAYGIRHHLDILREVGIDPPHFIATGGGVDNDLWLQIVSDVTGKQQQICRVRYPSAIGNALLAADATGHVEDLNHAISYVVGNMKNVEPRAQNMSVYTKYYGIFRELYSCTKELSAALTQLSRSQNPSVGIGTVAGSV